MLNIYGSEAIREHGLPSVLLNLATFTFEGRETRFALRNPSETEPPVRLARTGDLSFYDRYYCEVKIWGR